MELISTSKLGKRYKVLVHVTKSAISQEQLA